MSLGSNPEGTARQDEQQTNQLGLLTLDNLKPVKQQLFCKLLKILRRPIYFIKKSLKMISAFVIKKHKSKFLVISSRMMIKTRQALQTNTAKNKPPCFFVNC